MNGKFKYIFTIIITVFVISCITIPAFAKYVNLNDKDLNIEAEEFYFTSNLLEMPSTGGTFPEYTLGIGVDKINFSLNNFEDDLRINSDDITYEIVVKDSSDNVVYNNNGTIIANGNKNTQNYEVSSLSAGIYVVEVTSLSPYSKTLKGRFILQDTNEDINYSVSDGLGSTIVMLTISVTDYSGNINIAWPVGVLPDNSDPLMAGAIDCSNYTIYFNSYSEYTFIFFKTDSSKVYTNSDFIISK